MPNQVIGVLAHETGHIAGGHLSRLREELRLATTASIIGLILGAGAMVAASRSGSGSAGNAGMAALSAPQAMIQNSLLGLCALAGRRRRPRRRAVPQRHRAVLQGHVRHLQAARRPDPLRIARRRSLHAVASAAGRARAGAGRPGQAEPALGQEGLAGAAGAARPRARQALRLPRSARRRRAPLSDQRPTASPRSMRAPLRRIASAIRKARCSRSTP